MKIDEIAEFSTMEKRKSNKDSEDMVLIFDFREIGLLLGAPVQHLVTSEGPCSRCAYRFVLYHQKPERTAGPRR
jgi:hypothetical protein